MKAFYDDPEHNKLQTPSGKIEFLFAETGGTFPG
jgi:hypothetical protein